MKRTAGGSCMELSARCCRVALDLVRASRHRSACSTHPADSPCASSSSPLEKSFIRPWRGARRRVRPAGLRPAGRGGQSVGAEFLAVRARNMTGGSSPCEAALGTITSQFQEKESTFWNSALTITAYGEIHEIAFRPWQSDNIPRRYCSGERDAERRQGCTPCITRSSRTAVLPASARASNGA